MYKSFPYFDLVWENTIKCKIKVGVKFVLQISVRPAIIGTKSTKNINKRTARTSCKLATSQISSGNLYFKVNYYVFFSILPLFRVRECDHYNKQVFRFSFDFRGTFSEHNRLTSLNLSGTPILFISLRTDYICVTRLFLYVK